MGPHHLADPARDGRQPRQQGADPGRAVFLRRRPWRAGRRRGLRHRNRDRAQGRFRLTLRKDLRLDYPRAETPDHYITMAMDPDLDQCVVRALRDMIVLLGEKRNLSREDAYTLGRA